MDQKEFKLFYKNKSALLYTYLLEKLVSTKVCDEMMPNIFARFYRTRTFIPQNISREKWLLLITKKFMVDYFKWRTTEEGQQFTDAGITSFEASHLELSHQSQLTEWINSCSEEEQVAINECIISELPPAEVRFSIKARMQERLKEIEAKYKSGKFNEEVKKEDGNGKPKK